MTTPHNAPLTVPELCQLDKEALLAHIRTRYDVHFAPVSAGNTTIEVLQMTDMEAYIDHIMATLPPGAPPELPFWAKLWRTSFLLSHFVCTMPKDMAEGRTMLEIGAGIGVCGLFAATRGFHVTITDIDLDALAFARASILHNGLADNATIAHVDFTRVEQPDLPRQRYDYILGSEVLYKEDHYRPLTRFIPAHLERAPHAEAILAKEYNRKAKKFFKLAERDFRIASKTLGFKPTNAGDDDTRHLAEIFRIQPKHNA